MKMFPHKKGMKVEFLCFICEKAFGHSTADRSQAADSNSRSHSLSSSDCDRIVQAEAPCRPIERGIAGPELLAHVLVSKYSDHLSLYRRSEIYARAGVELDRSPLAEWVGASSRLLAPLVEALRRHVMAADTNYMPMTRRFQCWHQGWARRKRDRCSHGPCRNRRTSG